MEILVNAIGYAGFIAVAKYHKPSAEKNDGALSASGYSFV